MITTPTLLLDTKKCKENIAAMAKKAEGMGLIFRPHFKTHQSHTIGKWFREVGVTKITVSSVKMASYFAQEGWEDITIAFPVNILEIDAINHLANSVKLNVLIESPRIVDLLSEKLTSPVNALIKVNIGNNRAGIRPGNQALINEILAKIDKTQLITFYGFLGHAGHSYSCRGKEEIAAIHYQSTSQIIDLKKKYSKSYPHLLASVGDTPTCSVMDEFKDIDEIRPGNFVFYDLTQHQIGSCITEQIAVAMACPIVAIHKNQHEVVIYGGGVHFSKDFLIDEQHGHIYGKVVESSADGWGEIIEGAFLKSVSQEHGIVKLPQNLIDQCREGDLINILPVHSCMTADLMKNYLTVEGMNIQMMGS